MYECICVYVCMYVYGEPYSPQAHNPDFFLPSEKGGWGVKSFFPREKGGQQFLVQGVSSFQVMCITELIRLSKC